MSTNIVGYKISFDSTNIVQAYKELRAWQETIYESAYEIIRTHCVKKITHHWDNQTFLGKEFSLGANPMITVRNQLNNIFSKDPSTYPPDVDCNSEIVLFPDEDAIYLMLFTEQLSWRESLRNLWFVEGYHYWDHTDRPDYIDATEWAAREAKWRELLDGFASSPRVAGLVMTITDSMVALHHTNFVDHHLLMQAVPTIEQRVSRIALEQLMLSHTPEMPPHPQDIAEMAKASWNFIDYIRTPEGQKALNDRKLLLSLKLTKITTDILNGT